MIDESNDESLDNLIKQLNFYCEPSWKIAALGACFLIGIVVGCSTLTPMGDTRGRKPIYIIGILLHLLFMAGLFFTSNTWVMFFALFIFGVSVAARYYVGYTYNIEMQPKSHVVLVSTTMFIFESLTSLFICIYFWKISKDYKPL